MKTIMLAAVLAAAAMLAACDEDASSPSPNATATIYVEAAPYDDGTAK
ncbi:hypothetical protein [Sphingomonas sp. BK069]|nr:hypothetical protein [Sphingomonas sp. BK069]MBB3347312.1 ABC-type glycerol-3-phosphate transport system substrate-binding protein [Sphingomonas sp. BK069]